MNLLGEKADTSMNDELRWVSKGCDRRVKSYDKYDVNGYRFHTESHEKARPG